MVFRRSAIAIPIGVFTSTLARVLESREEIPAPATCGKVCLVPANYGACPSNDTTCLCSTPSVIQDVGSCVIKACTIQSEREATIAYMLGVCQSFGITVSIPSAFIPFVPSTLVPSQASHAQVPTSTSTLANPSTSGPAPPSGPGVAATAGAVTAAIAAIIIAILALICWRKRHNNARQQRARHGAILGGMSQWKTRLTVDRTDTVKSFFAGKEDRDDSSRGLLSKKPQRYWAPQRPSDLRVGYTVLGAGMTVPNQLAPPQPPPSHLKPKAFVGTPEDRDRARRPPRPAVATSIPSSTSGRPFTSPSHAYSRSGPYEPSDRYPNGFSPATSRPFTSPSHSHSRSGSYEPSDRHLDGVSPATSRASPAVSIATPFSAVRPFAGWDGSLNTPPSSASSPGALHEQEKQRAWAASERRAATEGSLPALPLSARAYADAAASHSGGGPGPASPRGHRRNLTIDTTNVNVSRPKLSVQRAPQGIATTLVPTRTTNPPILFVSPAPDPNPNPNPNPNPTPNAKPNPDAEDACASAAAELGRMFTADPSLSDHEIHESLRQRYHTTPTDGGHDPSSPAVPESATMEMYGIGFGVMGRKWEPRSAGAGTSAGTSTSASDATPSPHPHDAAAAAGKKRRSKSVKHVRNAKVPPSPMRFHSLTAASTSAPSTPTSSSPRLPTAGLDGGALRVPATPAAGGAAPAQKQTQAQVQTPPQTPAQQAQAQVRPLTERTAPPRHSVVPEDFSEEGLNLSRDSTRRW